MEILCVQQFVLNFKISIFYRVLFNSNSENGLALMRSNHFCMLDWPTHKSNEKNLALHSLTLSIQSEFICYEELELEFQ